MARPTSDDRYAKALALAKQSRRFSSKVHDALLKGVEDGHGPSMYALATWHLHGFGPIRKNLKKAIALLHCAAAKAVSEAWYDLAVCYELGRGEKLSKSDAVRCYLMAATLGDKKAIFEAGRVLYYDDVDLNKQISLLTKNLLDIADRLGVYAVEAGGE